MLSQQGMKSVPSAGGQLNINSSFGPQGQFFILELVLNSMGRVDQQEITLTRG